MQQSLRRDVDRATARRRWISAVECLRTVAAVEAAYRSIAFRRLGVGRHEGHAPASTRPSRRRAAAGDLSAEAPPPCRTHAHSTRDARPRASIRPPSSSPASSSARARRSGTTSTSAARRASAATASSARRPTSPTACTIGDCVKINAQVYVCTGVTIADRVMIAAGVIFTNDRYPRAFDPGRRRARRLRTERGHADARSSAKARRSAPARVIGPGLTIGAYAMVGMGAVVTARRPAARARVRQSGAPARLRLRLRRIADAPTADQATRRRVRCRQARLARAASRAPSRG